MTFSVTALVSNPVTVVSFSTVAGMVAVVSGYVRFCSAVDSIPVALRSATVVCMVVSGVVLTPLSVVIF